MHINTRKNNRGFQLPALLIALSITLLTNPLSSAWAGDADIDALKNQQQKLQNILDKIGESQDQRGQQKAMLNKIDQQMECNWALIQGYDTCEALHKKNLQEHLNCKQKTKKDAIECLSRIGTQKR